MTALEKFNEIKGLEKLKEKIIEKGLDYNSLTEPLGLDYSTIVKKMSGRTKIKLSEISKLRYLSEEDNPVVIILK